MGKVLMKGNEAVAEAGIRCGCRHYFGYPITPQNEISAYMAKNMPKVGGLCLQAESEIAAINMVLGAAASGVRAMTSSSSPGISLKSEGLSYIAGCDLPCLVVNVQRGGPGLGGIQAAQSDYYQATKAMGHGDLRLLVYSPSTIQEIVTLTSKSFDTSEKYRVPAMILTDGVIGQMMEAVDFDEMVISTPADKSWASCGHGDQRKKNIINSLYIEPEKLEAVVVARFKRYAEIEKNEVMFEEYMTDDAELIIVSYGITARICKSAVNLARKQNVKVGLFRPISLWPYPSDALLNLAKKDITKHFLVSELNMGQMVDDVKVSTHCLKPVSFYGRTGGMLPAPEEILAEIKKILGGKA
ncbi:MAG: 3-methyl-2-oxobutanoate dehydrogenase subunit VorB [Oscillospiraceae bacterium]|nr:3-methyl-2-oxobutanoate dehydrogenase subunit VorB [Oscillospiraceae bacterium]